MNIGFLLRIDMIILKSELASKLAATDPTRATAEIRDVERISREALTQVRSAVQGYRSRGIEHELAEERRTLETAGISIEEAIEPIKAKPLSPLQEGVFAMALREGITNVVRHAQATVCRLTLRHAGNWFEMEIADNGRGGAMEEGSGLSGMRQRVEAVGGVLERNGSCGSQPGTELRIRVPV